MAVSISRPDPTSPASVAEADFPTTRKGFEPAEVRSLLRAVAAELGRLQERERFLERELRTAQSNEPAPVELDDDTVTRLLGEETLRVLQTARESASQIRIKAEEGAARILREATDEANRIRHEAEVDAARRRSEAAAEADAEVSLAKQQGREMVNEARAYRERVLSELSRRRDVARQQIEQLIQGRDRLLQVFERARLVALDVVSELAPLGEPDDLIDLSPSTGPIPVVPDARADDSSVGDDTVPIVEEDAGDDAGATEGTTAVTAPGEGAAAAPGAGESGEADRGGDVVELFPGRSPVAVDDTVDDTADDTADVDDTVDVDADATTGATRPDVGGLFAKLRAADAEAGTAVEQRAADETGADETGADETRADETGADETGDGEAGDGEVAGETAGDETAGDETAADEEIATGETAEDDGGDAVAEEAETPFSRRDADLVPLIVAGARKLKRVLADEQNDVLDRLRRKEPVRSLDDLLPSLDEHGHRYADAVGAELRAAAVAGAATMVDDVGAVRSRVESDESLAPVVASLRTELVVPLRDRLERAVVDGSGDNDDITKRVRAVYREWKTQHIDDQLDDLFRLAHGGGILHAVEPGTPLRWIVDPAGPACPDAEDNALAGRVAAGDEYPTGHRCAPAHAGCRCLLALTDR